MKGDKTKKSWKTSLLEGIEEYLINFVYMAIFFSAIILYRRLVLAEYGIVLNDYFLGVIKALVIAKVVMIGDILKISHKFENKPLIIPIMYKAILFTLWVALFDVSEKLIRALINNGTKSDVYTDVMNDLSPEWLGSLLLIFLSFIPFFAFKELSKVLGEQKTQGLFINRKKGNENDNGTLSDPAPAEKIKD